jgi:hypothetical protein
MTSCWLRLMKSGMLTTRKCKTKLLTVLTLPSLCLAGMIVDHHFG